VNFFRRLEPPTNPLLEAYTAATGRAVQDTVGNSSTVKPAAAWIPAPEHPEVWAALATIGNSTGVIDHTTPGFLFPTTPQEQP
jgi:hypothetical protein